jgi:hypothetical protein
MEQKLTDLVDRLRKAHGEALRSVILYGSGATGDHHAQYSDLNVLCVLTQVTPAELADSESVFKWWRAQGNPSPLLLSAEEVRTSTDCFPIEFHDMAEGRRVLFGEDVIENLAIDKVFYRAQVEHELRSKLLRLRQKAAVVLKNPQELQRLMIDSVSNFLVLARHALLVSGIPVTGQKREISKSLASIGVDPSPFDTLLDLREQGKKRSDVAPEILFKDYLRQIEAVVTHVDGLDK